MTSKRKNGSTVNVRGINQLLNGGKTKHELANLFQVSRPFLDRLIAGETQPAHVGITLYINWQVKGALITLRG